MVLFAIQAVIQHSVLYYSSHSVTDGQGTDPSGMDQDYAAIFHGCENPCRSLLNIGEQLPRLEYQAQGQRRAWITGNAFLECSVVRPRPGEIHDVRLRFASRDALRTPLVLHH